MKTTIPFDGFYESRHDADLDDVLERMATDDSGHVYPYAVDLWETVDYRKVHLAYAQLYADCFAGLFGAETGIALPLTFLELNSPQFYNYKTDRIFCDVPVETVKALFAVADKAKLGAFIEARFTSRSGFHSFYDNSLESWEETDIAEWDINQVGTLIESVFYQFSDENTLWYMMDDINGNGDLDNMLYDGMSAEGIAILDRASTDRKAGLYANDVETETAE